MPVIDIAADGSTAAVHFRKTGIACNKLEWDEELKKEKVRRIGHQGHAARTEGAYEAKDASVEVEVWIWSHLILPKLPKNGYGNFPFPVKGQFLHPDVAGSYTVLLSSCCIIGEKGSIEASEKAGMITIPLSVMQVRKRDGRGDWHSLNRIRTQPNSLETELML